MKTMVSTLSTAALVVTVGFANTISAQTAPRGDNLAAGQETADPRSFLSMRSQADMHVSELIGHDVYARAMTIGGTLGDQMNTGDQAAATRSRAVNAPEDQPAAGLGIDAYAAINSDGSSNLAEMPRADFESLENIGSISDLVLTMDGRARAIVVDVGGIGQQFVAVTMDQFVFGAHPEDQSELLIVVNVGHEKIRSWPGLDPTF